MIAENIEKNQAAFNWGRMAAADVASVTAAIDNPGQSVNGFESLDDAIRRRAVFLAEYQDDDLAERFISLVDRVRNAETELSGGTDLADTAMRAYFKTLAYKDEYEVARLHTETDFVADVRTQFGKDAKLRFHLAPPLLSRSVDSRGRPHVVWDVRTTRSTTQVFSTAMVHATGAAATTVTVTVAVSVPPLPSLTV